MRTLSEQVGKTIQSRKLFRRGQSILVAVSGGVDSMVLLHLLHQLAHKSAWRLVVAHFNHQLRGVESDGDERLVHAVAAELNLPFVSERWGGQARRQARGLGLEMAAREARHEFLGRTAVQRKIPTVALAHHADDQVELFFLRLFRGAGGEGLGGMKWLGPALFHESVQLARPLLDQPKAALEELAQQHDVAFREDASNAGFDHQRNRIRHELLPLLRKHYAPAVARTITRTMEIIQAEAEWVACAAQKWVARPSAKGFDRLPLALQRQCLRWQLQQRGIPAGYELVESLRHFPNREVTTEPGCCVVRDQSGRISLPVQRAARWNAAKMRLDISADEGIQLFDGVEVAWKLIRKKPAFFAAQSPSGCEYFSDLGLTPAVRLRHWRNGDRFQPIGLGQAVKLQDLFTNLKIPRAQRRELLVAETMAGQIFWVEGLRVSEQFKLDKATVRIVKWQWCRRSTVAGGRLARPG